jgi:hypothetical protein
MLVDFGGMAMNSMEDPDVFRLADESAFKIYSAIQTF